jgi:glyoxylase I family protein
MRRNVARPVLWHALDMDDLARIHHVALCVRERDASASWYAEVLGFEELFREDGDERTACVMRFPGGGYSVGLVEHRPGDETPFDPRRRGLDHLDVWSARLREAGVEHSGPLDIPTGAILNFKDPDGIGLALFWDKR